MDTEVGTAESPLVVAFKELWWIQNSRSGRLQGREARAAQGKPDAFLHAFLPGTCAMLEVCPLPSQENRDRHT